MHNFLSDFLFIYSCEKSIKTLSLAIVIYYRPSLCARTKRLKSAASAGKYTIGVEPMPYSGLPGIRKAWEVVKDSGCDNAKLILDFWHWIRAGQSYDPALMADIPAEKIVAIQLNDVQARAYAAAILRDESMHDCALPGKGYGDTAGFVEMIKAKGGPRKPCLFTDDTVDIFREVAERCHRYGAKVNIQLQHAGPEGHSMLATGDALNAALAI